MTLDELQQQLETMKPLHMLGDGKTALTLHTPTGHYIFLCDPVSGEVSRRKLPYSGSDAHLGAVSD